MVVPRPRLVDAIQKPNLCRVTLVIAGAGCGKSTVLSTFADQATMPVGWLTLTVADNDPWVFSRHVSETIRTMETPASVREAMATPVHEQTSDPTVLPFEISSVPGEFCLLLDDCERITNERVFELIDRIISSLPEGGSIILSGRNAIPLRLARLRASGQVRDIGQQELRFTIPETESLMELRTTPEIAGELSWHIWTASSGWAAGIALAGLSWQRSLSSADGDSPDPQATWYRFVADYVEEEILRDTPAEQRQLALMLSSLPYLSRDVVEVAVGPLPQRIDIGSAGQRYAFLEQVAGHPGRYRFHPLVARSLRDIARRDIPAAERQEIQSRVVRYLTDQGEVSAAAQVALLDLGAPWIRDLIEPVCKRLADRSDFDALLELSDKLPPSVLEANPALQYWGVIARLALGQTHGLAEDLDKNEAILRELGYALGLGRVFLCRGFLTIQEGDPIAAETALQEALKTLPVTAVVERMYAHTLLGQLDLDDGNDSEADEHLEQAAACALLLPIDEQWAWKELAAGRANTYAIRGDLHSAITKYELLLDELPADLASLEGFLHCRLVTLFIEQDDLEQAQSHLRQAERLRMAYPGSWLHALALATARLHLAQGDLDAANRVASGHIKRLRRLPEKDQFVFLLARIWISRGEFSLVRHWLADSSATANAPLPLFRDLPHIQLSIEADLAEGNYASAAEAARRMADVAQTTRRMSRIVEAKMRLAVALHFLGDNQEADEAVRAAIDRGTRAGYVRSFLVPGFDIVEMFSNVMQETREGQELRRRLSRAVAVGKPQHGSQLTSREIEILKRVAAGESNRDIADALFISTNTVRNHLVKAFRHLEARSRSEAVSRARELGLLD